MEKDKKYLEDFNCVNGGIITIKREAAATNDDRPQRLTG